MISHPYAHESHYMWVESRCKIACSPFGRKIANIIGYVGNGIYNAPIKPEKVDWDDEDYIVVNWGGDLTNWDNKSLSKLFVLCARQMIRFTIEPSSPSTIKLSFWQREGRTGGISHCLPDAEDLIKDIDNDFSENWKGGSA